MNERIDRLLEKLEPIAREITHDEKLIQDYFALRDLFGLLNLWFALGDFKRKKVNVSDENIAKYERLTDLLIELCSKYEPAPDGE